MSGPNAVCTGIGSGSVDETAWTGKKIENAIVRSTLVSIVAC